ncbi:MAG TPA: DUF2079 domain-containing protein [Thermomicrobiales bacterium]|nr:DUF2079 domain-containing protein [Thermomicrobiales bacterium]
MAGESRRGVLGAAPAREAAVAGRGVGALARLEAVVAAYAPALLAALVVLFTIVFTVINIWRVVALRQGFDVLFYEQPIWNTANGRWFQQSMVGFAPTQLGQDLVLFELWVAPFYKLWPSHDTLFALVSLGAGLGALPVFALARARHRSALAGFGWAVLYLAFLPVDSITVWEFQPRLFAATALLFAFWCYRRERPALFWLCLVVAITVRADVGLVVGCLGLYTLLERRTWRYGWGPAIFGFGYFVVTVYLIVPAFAHGSAFHWAINYDWLGTNTRAILATIVRHPLYTAEGVVTLEKARYLAQLLWPLGFLPLLRPRLLLPALPILALNLLSDRAVQFDLFHSYQALIVPFLFLAALEGLADLCEADPQDAAWGRRAGRLRRSAVLIVAALVALVLFLPWPGTADSRNGIHHALAPLVALTLVALVAVPAWLGAAALASRAVGQSGGDESGSRAVGQSGSRVETGRAVRLRAWPAAPVVLVALLGLMLLQQVMMGSEVVHFLKDPRPSPRLAAGEQLIREIPPDAPLAVTSQLGVHVPLRRDLYAFPGTDLYDPALVQRARYILGDRQRSPEENAAIDRLVASGQWRVVDQRAGFVLLERR